MIRGGVASPMVPGRTPGGAIGATILGTIGDLLGGLMLSLALGRGTASVAIIGAVIMLHAPPRGG